MIKKLVAHGNSSALIIEKPILQLLKADENTSFEISTDGRSLILSPVAGGKREKKFSASLTRAGKAQGKPQRKPAE